MNKGILAILHALLATSISYGLMFIEVIQNPFWLVVTLGVSWFIWLPFLVKDKQWASLISSAVLVSPCSILVYKLLGIVYG
ncbi:MAG: hypothetical protein KUG83_01585 [Gammaproteobacteria bacterium]|nr:hypothetical protein [Gammaproteobacteria bacterium]